MAFLWQNSFVPNVDPNGNPYVGAQAFFYAAGTTTPKAVYWDSAFDAAHDHPVLSDGAGRFPAVFIPEGDFRVRVLDASGVTLWDADGITVPSAGGGGGGGDTPIELLARTGDIKARYGTGAHSGWVRANGRTIGSGASGASERANSDCEGLFEHLWNSDSRLTVSGGRGANAASDWSAGKTIQLPDMRGRAVFGLADMGNTASNRIPNSLLDETNATLGAAGGTGTVALTSAQMPSHTHSGTTQSAGAHVHQTEYGSSGGGSWDGPQFTSNGTPSATRDYPSKSAGSHTHSFTTNESGGGDAHSNLPPALLATWYIKL